MTVLETVDAQVDALGGVRKRRSRQGWSHQYSLIIVDVMAAATSALIIYGSRASGLSVVRQPSVTRNVVTVLMPLLWVLVLAVHRGYNRWSADGSPKTRGRVVQAALTLMAVMSSACLALQYTALMDQILFGIPLTALSTILLRGWVQRWMRVRGHDTYLRRALIVGHATSVGGLLGALGRDRGQGLTVVGACLADDHAAAVPVPVYGDLTDIRGTALAAGCDCVIAAPGPDLDIPQLRQLGWDLHEAGIELLVAPALTGVAQERLTVRPAGDASLVHIRPPVFTGPQRVLKGLLDRSGAIALLVVAVPVLLGIALLIRATSSGPALFKQRRVGRGGREFTLLKFRTMAVDAEARRAELVHLNERREGLLFKIRADPRITRVGGFLRRYSLDELPQLLNVVAGSMSLVGPRPPLPQEVAAYDATIRRRLLVKPGLTGLWQVSGRSNLSWPESVRLDLSYVDNWSPALDLKILLRTAVAVIKGTGAY